MALPFNLKILDERLKTLITRFGQEARESRQIARRLHDLLPRRFRELKREHAAEHDHPGAARRRGGAVADRMTLTDERYLEHIDEMCAIQARAREARIQYETHMMLFEARRSLRALRAA